MSNSNKNEWWRNAIIYQIYPRSFLDSNDDGIGDIAGIVTKLDYIASLGVDAIWVSPFFTSPMKDFGYDVSNYHDIDPIFGNMDDFNMLIEGAHKRNLKVIIEQIYSHSSNLHPWFRESRQNKTNPKSDWYVWHDPKPDGSPPNNWQAIFGGPAWTFDSFRKQYYFHQFLPEQPDLNIWNINVQDELCAIAKFWLDKGVDGFRMDATNQYMHNRSLKDNPARDTDDPIFKTSPVWNPNMMQHHINDKSQPENLEFIEKIREITDQYPDKFLLGEIFEDKDIEIKLLAEYTKGDKRLNTAYCFNFLCAQDLTSHLIQDSCEEFYKLAPDSWPSWSFSNHDWGRAVSRWGKKHKDDPNLGKMLIALLCSLRGTIQIYQSEELGLPDTNINFEDLRDPLGIYTWPQWKGRDGCRTPIPWTDKGEHLGFSNKEGKIWLPAQQDQKDHSVLKQKQDNNSVLNHTISFTHWRKQDDITLYGDINFIDLNNEQISCFKRKYKDKENIYIFNLSHLEIKIPLESIALANKLSTSIKNNSNINDKKLTLKSFGYAILSKD